LSPKKAAKILSYEKNDPRFINFIVERYFNLPTKIKSFDYYQFEASLQGKIIREQKLQKE
jgi:hypothetical protein